MMIKIAEYYEETGNITAALSEINRALLLLSAMKEEEKIEKFKI